MSVKESYHFSVAEKKVCVCVSVCVCAFVIHVNREHTPEFPTSKVIIFG